MDLATIGGFLVAVATIALGAHYEHVTIESLLGKSAFLIVVGGTIGATMLSHTMEHLKAVPRAIGLALIRPRQDYAGMIDYLLGLTEKARRSGLLSLQDDAEKASNRLVRHGLLLVVDGSDPEVVLATLDAISVMETDELKHAAAAFDTAGGYSPTIGILGTVMGLVQVMGNLADPDSLGTAIAVAFLATLYGVGLANLVLLPFGAKIKAVALQQAKYSDMIIEAISGIQAGENPRNLREKLFIYHGGKAVKHAKPETTTTATTAQEGA